VSSIAAGEGWITESVDRLRKALREVNARAEAVMEYQLARLEPAEMETQERLRWLALAVRLGRGLPLAGLEVGARSPRHVVGEPHTIVMILE
jgi:hypothetical protein